MGKSQFIWDRYRVRDFIGKNRGFPIFRYIKLVGEIMEINFPKFCRRVMMAQLFSLVRSCPNRLVKAPDAIEYS